MMKRLCLLMTMLGLLGWAGPAMACPVLKKADPRVGSVLQAAPPEAVLHFSGPVLTDQSTLEVRDAAGQVVSMGAVHHEGNDDTVAVALAPLPVGRYKVRWTILCNCEGGDRTAIPGDYSFTVKP